MNDKDNDIPKIKINSDVDLDSFLKRTTAELMDKQWREEVMTAKDHADRSQQRVIDSTINFSVGGGMIDITANGMGKVSKVVVDDSLLQADSKEMLEDLIRAGYNQLWVESDKVMQREFDAEVEKMQAKGGSKKEKKRRERLDKLLANAESVEKYEAELPEGKLTIRVIKPKDEDAEY